MGNGHVTLAQTRPRHRDVSELTNDTESDLIILALLWPPRPQHVSVQLTSLFLFTCTNEAVRPKNVWKKTRLNAQNLLEMFMGISAETTRNKVSWPQKAIVGSCPWDARKETVATFPGLMTTYRLFQKPIFARIALTCVRSGSVGKAKHSEIRIEKDSLVVV